MEVEGLACPFCGTALQPDMEFCTSCGKALKDAERSESDTRKKLKEQGFILPEKTEGEAAFDGFVEEYLEKEKKKGALTILVLSAIQLVSALLLFLGGDLISFVFTGFIGMTFMGLYAFSFVKRKAAIISCLALYVSLVALGAIVEPKSLTQGIVIKIIIVGSLLRALKAHKA